MEVSVTNFHQYIIDIENLFVQYISNGKPPDIFSEYIGKIYCLEDQIKNANWIDSELSKPGSLMDCIGLIISLSAILSESSSQHLSTSKIFWLIKFQAEKSILKIGKQTDSNVSEQLMKEHLHRNVYCKQVKQKWQDFRVIYVPSEEEPNHSRTEYRMALMRKSILEKGITQLDELADKFCDFYQISDKVQNDNVHKNVKMMVDGIVMCPWYLAALPLYFFYMFVKRNNYLTEQHIDEYPKKHDLFPVLSFTEKDVKQYSNNRYFKLFNQISAILFESDPSTSQNKTEQNIWKQIYGYLDIDQHTLAHLYVYYSFPPMPFADSIDEESNPSNSLLNGSYSPEELWDLKYEKLQRDRRNELMQKREQTDLNELLTKHLRVLNTRAHLEVTSAEKGAALNLQNVSAINELYNMLQSYKKIEFPFDLLPLLRQHFNTDYCAKSADELSISEKYQQIYHFLYAKRCDLSAIILRKELRIGRETPLAGEEDLHIVRDDFIQFAQAIEKKRKLLYPEWFQTYRRQHFVLTPDVQMCMLDIRQILITYPWTATDYIEFTQNYQDQTTFTKWLYGKLLSQATNTKSHKMITLISILTDINKSKTLKGHIAAAAFYQMISNLIHFMREEMLSLL